MTAFRPRYVTFDCHGTLIHYQMAEAARTLYGERLDEPRMRKFIHDFSAYRLDEVMGAWKPYAEVVHDALERACRASGIAFRPEDARWIYEQVPSWGPHPDVPATAPPEPQRAVGEPRRARRLPPAPRRPSGGVGQARVGPRRPHRVAVVRP